MKIISYKENIKEACEICLKNNFYVEGWTFQMWFEYQDYRDRINTILIGYINNKPIGCLVYMVNLYPHNFGVYVHSKFRRKGYGTKLVNYFLENEKEANIRECRKLESQFLFYEKTLDSIFC